MYGILYQIVKTYFKCKQIYIGTMGLKIVIEKNLLTLLDKFMHTKSISLILATTYACVGMIYEECHSTQWPQAYLDNA
jgi:hypothetical protein